MEGLLAIGRAAASGAAPAQGVLLHRIEPAKDVERLAGVLPQQPGEVRELLPVQLRAMGPGGALGQHIAEPAELAHAPVEEILHIQSGEFGLELGPLVPVDGRRQNTPCGGPVFVLGIVLLVGL